MGRVLAVILVAGLLVCPAVGYAQYDMSQSDSSDASESTMSEETQAGSNLSNEITADEASSKAEMEDMDQSMAGNSESQAAVAEEMDQ